MFRDFKKECQKREQEDRREREPDRLSASTSAEYDDFMFREKSELEMDADFYASQKRKEDKKNNMLEEIYNDVMKLKVVPEELERLSSRIDTLNTDIANSKEKFEERTSRIKQKLHELKDTIPPSTANNPSGRRFSTHRTSVDSAVEMTDIQEDLSSPSSPVLDDERFYKILSERSELEDDAAFHAAQKKAKYMKENMLDKIYEVVKQLQTTPEVLPQLTNRIKSLEDGIRNLKKNLEECTSLMSQRFFLSTDVSEAPPDSAPLPSERRRRLASVPSIDSGVVDI